MAEITVFGIPLFIGFGAISAVISLVLWGWVTIRANDAMPDRSFLYQATIYLTVLTLIVFDIIIVGGFTRVITGNTFRLAFTFGMGVQLVAGISAVLYIRRRLSA